MQQATSKASQHCHQAGHMVRVTKAMFEFVRPLWIVSVSDASVLKFDQDECMRLRSLAGMYVVARRCAAS